MATYTKHDGLEAIQRANAQWESVWKWWRYERTTGNFALVAYVVEHNQLVEKAFLLLRRCTYVRFAREMDHVRFEIGTPSDPGSALALPLPACTQTSPYLVVLKAEAKEGCMTCSDCTLYELNESAVVEGAEGSRQ